MKSLKDEVWDNPSKSPYSAVPDRPKYQLWDGVISIDFLHTVIEHIKLKCENEARV